MLILNEQDLGRLLDMRAVIDAVEEGFRAIARGETLVPDRVALPIPNTDAVMFNMPSALTRSNALGTKVVSVFPQNNERGIEVVQSVYLLLDGETGVPLALMDGRYITGIRTAATSAVATRFMADRHHKKLAIFGAGVQARFHFRAMIEVAAIESVFVCSRNIKNAEKLAEEVRSSYDVSCEVTSPEIAVSGASLICACTTSREPLFDGSLVSPGAHINAVGSYTPDARELDTESVRRSRVFIDAESGAGREAGDILIPMAEGAVSRDHVAGSLADVVIGRVTGRRSPDEITLFKSCGLAIEDLVTARLAYELALRREVGFSFRL